MTEIGSGVAWKKMKVSLFTEKEHWIKPRTICITLTRTSALITVVMGATPSFGIRSTMLQLAALSL